MPVTEKQRHERFTKAEELLGPDEAATTMELIAPHDLGQLATKADLARELERFATKADLADLRAELHQALSTQTRTFVTWLLTSQSVLIGLVIAALVQGG